MDNYESIERALDFIEKNIKNDISLQDISKFAYLSPFHFHRIFSYTVGEPVMRYLKLRRLTCALEDLIQSNKRIIDIACEYQFESEEVFLRAFKKEFGVTPGSYRKGKKVLNSSVKQSFSPLLLKKIKDGEYYMNRIIIVEVGSTNTKTYMAYEDGRVDILPLKYIGLKAGYSFETGFDKDNTQKLKDHINELKEKYNIPTRMFGTSIFRTAKEEHKKDFIEEVKQETGVELHVISQQEEIENTVFGVIGNVDTELTVLITGGGSTEVVKCKGRKIVDSYRVEIGVEEVIKNFKGLANDKADVDIDEVISFIRKELGSVKIDTEVLVLAGGQHIMFSDIAKYPIEKNTYYEDINQKYMISIEDAYEYDRKFFEEYSLEKLKESSPDNKSWWDGARAARAVVESFARDSKVKHIIPTDINMIYGLAKKAFEK